MSAAATLPAPKLLVVEHKTSSEDIGLGSMYWRKLTLDAQISNYLVGARTLGHEPDGVLYDVLRKPALRPLDVSAKRKTPETPDEYRARCLDAIVEKPDAYYQRGVVVRLEDEERDAAFDTWQTADAIRLARHTGRWPRNVDSCNDFHRMCEYWPVCSGEASIEDRALYAPPGPLHPELGEGAKKVHLPLLTSSSARTFRTCAKKYQFTYEMALRPLAAKAGALFFGQVIHKGLEAWLNTGFDLDAALAAMHVGAYDHDAAKAEAMMRGYHARWSSDPLDVVAVEAEFTAPLLNPETGAASRTFARAGKIDAIVRIHGGI